MASCRSTSWGSTFFFSSRRRHTRWNCDWSSDVCSSDLYANTPLFTSSPDYTRLAPNSVMSMALDTLDKTSPVRQPDMVTGTKVNANGNFYVWFNQSSNNNEGYFPSTFSTSQNYKTNDAGD